MFIHQNTHFSHFHKIKHMNPPSTPRQEVTMLNDQKQNGTHKKNDDVWGDVILFKSDLPGPQWLQGGGEGGVVNESIKNSKEGRLLNILNISLTQPPKTKTKNKVEIKNSTHFRNQVTHKRGTFTRMCAGKGGLPPSNLPECRRELIKRRKHSGDKTEKLGMLEIGQHLQ